MEGFSEALAQEVALFGIKVVIGQTEPFRIKLAAGSLKLGHQHLDEYKQTPLHSCITASSALMAARRVLL